MAARNRSLMNLSPLSVRVPQVYLKPRSTVRETPVAEVAWRRALAGGNGTTLTGAACQIRVKQRGPWLTDRGRVLARSPDSPSTREPGVGSGGGGTGEEAVEPA